MKHHMTLDLASELIRSWQKMRVTLTEQYVKAPCLEPCPPEMWDITIADLETLRWSLENRTPFYRLPLTLPCYSCNWQAIPPHLLELPPSNSSIFLK